MYLRTLLLGFVVFISCEKMDIKVEITKDGPEVFFAIGDVTINGQAAKIGQQINDGDVVETGVESYLEAKFGKQSAFRIRKESKVVFNIDDQVTLSVEKGNVLNILEKKSRYLVRTPSAVAAVRGTIFCVSVINDNKTYFCACNGTIVIEDDHQKEMTTLSSAHHQPNYVERNENELSLSDAGMIDHDDLEIFDFMYRLDQAISR